MTGGGFAEAGGKGFLFAAKPVFPDIFFDDRELVLGAAGKVILAGIRVFVDIAFDGAGRIIGIFLLVTEGTEDAQVPLPCPIGGFPQLRRGGTLVRVVAGPAACDHSEIDQLAVGVDERKRAAMVVGDFLGNCEGFPFHQFGKQVLGFLPAAESEFGRIDVAQPHLPAVGQDQGVAVGDG